MPGKQAANQSVDSKTALSLLESLPAMVWLGDATLQCLGVNQAWRTFTGRPADAALGEGWLDAVGENQRQDVRRRLTAMRESNEGGVVAFSMRDASGQMHPVEMTLQPAPDGPAAYLAVCKPLIEMAESAEEALRERRTRYELAADAANDGLWDWDLTNDCVYYSSQWKKLMGYAREDELKTPDDWFVRIASSDMMQLQADLALHQAGATEQLNNEHRVIWPDGTQRWLHVRGRVILNEEGEAVRLIGSLSDATERKEAENRLRYEATHDRLTGLANRAMLLEKLEQAVSRSKRSRLYRFALMMLDFDRFKIVNDSLGHDAGDQLLNSIADRFRQIARKHDTACRIGGDEFVLLMDNVKDEQEVIDLATQVVETMREVHDIQGHPVTSTASIGIAISHERYQDSSEMLRDADTALYRAKAEGKDRFVMFDEQMYQNLMDRLTVENSMRFAQDRDELEVYYQPIVGLQDGRIEGFEALLRWNSDHGRGGPAMFIELAEETGLIIPIGRWVLEQACRQLVRWQKHFPVHRNLHMNINVSRRQLIQPGFVAMVQSVLEETGVTPAQIHLEVTESVVVEERSNVLETLLELAELGIVLSMDDFGTGQSSLSQLHDFPIRQLKIDKSFVWNTDDHRAYTAIMHAVVTLAENLNLDVVAEGIETPSQLALLQSIGVQGGQGFLFSKPVPVEMAERLLNQAEGFRRCA